jgi:phosphohistidine phosphatase
MKTLTLIRHAHAAAPDAYPDDYQRPLTASGERDAAAMGARLARRGLSPQRILASSAPRARRTAGLIAQALRVPPAAIHEQRALYLAGYRELLAALRVLEPELEHAVLVAHNPGLTLLCNYLTPDRLDELPTAGVFQIEFDRTDWGELDEGVGRLRLFDFPARPE